MTIFDAFTWRRSTLEGAAPEQEELPEAIRQALPRRFEVVGEALASATDTTGACAVVGRDVARDGADLGEALSGLRTTFEVVLGVEPDFASVEALSTAWSDATLEYLHQISCEDPLTGLASLAHVRSRLDELYREADQTDTPVMSSHALVIVEMCAIWPSGAAEHQFTRTLRMVQLAEAMRTVFPGGETLGRLGLNRAVAVVPRHADLGAFVATLRDHVNDLDLGANLGRVWIEGLPPSSGSAARLLDDLAR